MNDKRLLIKLLSNKWDNTRCKCHLRKSWGTQMDSLMKELDLQGKVLDVKIIKKALDERVCEEFQIPVQHKSQWCIYMYKELKQDVGFKKHLQYAESIFQIVFLVHSGTYRLFEELGRHANTCRCGSDECPNCGACKELVEHVLFEYTSYDSLRQYFLWTTQSKFFLQMHLKVFFIAVFSIKLYFVSEKNKVRQ